MKLEDKLFLVRFQPDKTSHLHIVEGDICLKQCKEKPCTFFCPAKVYEWHDTEERIQTAYEGCLECGTCWIGCPYDNIDWSHPRGGFGVMYKFG